MHLVRGEPADVEFAEAWFIRAVLLESERMLWRVVEEYASWGSDSDIRRWFSRAMGLTFNASGDGLRVHPALFEIRVNEWGHGIGQDFSVQICSADAELAMAALGEAAWHFSLVGEDGCRYEDDDEVAEASIAQGRDIYTPNYVGEPERHADGPTLRIDCKDGVMPAMARTMTEILFEELRAVGLTEAELRPAPR